VLLWLLSPSWRAGGELHGPYWYLYWKKDGKTKSKYVGKSRPARA
jgi:hypothetical protein